MAVAGRDGELTRPLDRQKLFSLHGGASLRRNELLEK
jgi:hypothetical protein